MQPAPNSLSLARVRLIRILRSLRQSLLSWLPQPAPALVPIPIRAERGRLDDLRRARHRVD